MYYYTTEEQNELRFISKYATRENYVLVKRTGAKGLEPTIGGG